MTHSNYTFYGQYIFLSKREIQQIMKYSLIIYTEHFMTMMVCQISLCVYIRLSKTIKLCQVLMLIIPILKEKMCTELNMFLKYLFSTSLLSRFTVSQLLAICRFNCVKNTYVFLNKISAISAINPSHLRIITKKMQAHS